VEWEEVKLEAYAERADSSQVRVWVRGEVCRGCGEKEERSKVPSWRCDTGMERGASSEVRVCVKDDRAAVIADSGRWKAGVREGIIVGVKTSTDGLTAANAGLVVEWRVGWGRGRD
jgi:hypothetical protein